MLSVHGDEHYMREALKQAKIAYEAGEIPIGAVVVCQNQIIARAHNQVERLNDVTAHAEILAITAAENFLGSKYLNECKMYVTLEPCTMCGGALSWAQLSELIYGASDPQRGYTIHQRQVLHTKTKVKSGILADEAGILVNQFFNEIRGNNKS